MANVEGRWGLLLVCLGLSCAPRMPAEYVRHADAAEAATRERRHRDAAREWGKAANVAETDADRQEARYREATSSLRAGDGGEYRRRLTSLSQQAGPRQERAAYDLALNTLRHDPAAGGPMVHATIVKYANSGLARGALDRWLATIPESGRAAALSQLYSEVTDADLREYILLLQARNYTAAGRHDQALTVYVRLEHDHGYPYGRFWDEAMLEQAMLLFTNGDHSRAIATLERMLSFREESTIVGSYERRYSDATLLLVYIELDQDWQKARDHLHRFPSQYPTSRWRDDALWASALLARDNNATEQACVDAALLRQSSPTSRYVACLHHVCPSLAPSSECRSYVVEQRNTASATLRAALPGALGAPRGDAVVPANK